MNILFLTTHLNTGGITQYLLTLTKGFRALGHQIHCVSSGGNMEESFKALGAVVKNLNICTKSELDPRIYWVLPELKTYVQKNGIQVIHSHTRITQVMGRLLKDLTKVPYTSTCHGFFKTRISRRIVPCWGDKVIAISQAVSDHLSQDFRVLNDKIRLVDSGIDVNQYNVISQDEKLAQRKKFALGKEPVIGIIARLSDVKGQDILISSMPYILKTIPDAKLLVIGEGKMKDVLKKMVNDLDLEKNVIFLPNVINTKETLSTLDVFVMPSRQEGLGLSIMEAQACGLAVVASRVGGIPSLIEDGKTGFLFESENSKDLAEKIITVLNDPDRACQMGRSARSFIVENHSAEKMIEGTLNVYKELVQ